jgi:HD-GYP domain-containing protein (c-di-GMP phosphodiesterase class II)
LGVQLAESTARELGLDEHHVQCLRLATMICDLGREQIPAAILDKPAPLSEEDWARVRRQPGCRDADRPEPCRRPRMDPISP